MQNNSFEQNIRFFKNILPYNYFYELIKNKNSFSEIKKRNLDKNLIEVEITDGFSIRLNTEVKNDRESEIVVFTSLLSYFLFIQNLSKNPKVIIIILEDLQFLGSLFLSFNINQYIKEDSNYFFILSESDIDNTINYLAKNLQYFNEPIINIKIDKYDSILSTTHKSLINSFSQKLNELIIDYTTHFVMLPKQIINILENIKYIKNTIDISKDNNEFSLVISAGPSLNDAIKIIKNIKENVFIIAVDTVTRFLLKNDVIPDIILVLDPQNINFLDFVGINNIDSSILLIEISSSYRVSKKYQNFQNVAFFAGLLPSFENENSFYHVNNLSNYISEKFKLFNLPVFGNVGLAAISLASKISKNIILAGFDSSYPSLIYHCNETLDIDFNLKNQIYFKPALSTLTKESLFLSIKKGDRTSAILKKNEDTFKQFFPQKNFIFLKNYDDIRAFQNQIIKIEKKKSILIKNIIKNIINEFKINDDFKKNIVDNIEKSFYFFQKSKEKSNLKIKRAIDRIFS